jgi:death-on-curing protein
MEFPTSYLDVDDVIEIFETLIGSARDLLRSRDLLESAVLAPQQSAFGEDAYPTIGQKAWACLRGWRRTMPSSTAISESRGRLRVPFFS